MNQSKTNSSEDSQQSEDQINRNEFDDFKKEVIEIIKDLEKQYEIIQKSRVKEVIANLNRLNMDFSYYDNLIFENIKILDEILERREAIMNQMKTDENYIEYLHRVIGETILNLRKFRPLITDKELAIDNVKRSILLMED